MSARYPESLSEMAALYEGRDPRDEAIRELSRRVETLKVIEALLTEVAVVLQWRQGNDVY